MKYEMKFGRLNKPAFATSGQSRFRIAVLGDFSGRASGGTLEKGDALAARKPHNVDVDNLDDVIARFQIQLHLPLGSEGIAKVGISSMDDFHPDELYDNVEVFEELSGLRRRLANSSTFPAAADEVRSWLGEAGSVKPDRATGRARGSTIPAGKLSDFAALVGRPTASSSSASDVDELIRTVVAPYVVPNQQAEQEHLTAAVDQALSGAMRGILHHPDFQSMESLWRAVDLLVHRLESGTNLQIVLHDITAEEFAADLGSAESLDETGIYKLLVEQPATDAQQGPYSLIIAAYTFDLTPPHAELLGRVAQVAAASGAPFVASITPECLKIKKPEEIHPLILESWEALRQLPQAPYIALTVPRFMLRWPYGKKTEPITPFEFEEFDAHSGLKGMLWGNSAFLVGLLLGETFTQQGMKQMKLGSILSVGDIPFYYYTDEHGDQTALPSTERLVTERLAAHATGQHFIPVLAIKGRPEVRLGGFLSLAGADLAGPWAPDGKSPATASPQAVAAPSEPSPPVQTAAPQTPEEEAKLESEVDAELDALLSGLDEPAGSPPTEGAATPDGSDAELDALLAGLDADSQAQPEAADDEMDPELAALLAEL